MAAPTSPPKSEGCPPGQSTLGGNRGKGVTPIRIDERAAAANYASVQRRRALAAALLSDPGSSGFTDEGREALAIQQRIARAERALVAAAADFEALTSHAEAAALFALFAANCQKRDPTKRTRGKPRKGTPSAKAFRLSITVNEVLLTRSDVTRGGLIREIASMSKDGLIVLDGTLPSDGPGTSLATLEKRVRRAIAKVKAYKDSGGT